MGVASLSVSLSAFLPVPQTRRPVEAAAGCLPARATARPGGANCHGSAADGLLDCWVAGFLLRGRGRVGWVGQRGEGLGGEGRLIASSLVQSRRLLYSRRWPLRLQSASIVEFCSRKLPGWAVAPGSGST